MDTTKDKPGGEGWIMKNNNYLVDVLDQFNDYRELIAQTHNTWAWRSPAHKKEHLKPRVFRYQGQTGSEIGGKALMMNYQQLQEMLFQYFILHLFGTNPAKMTSYMHRDEMKITYPQTVDLFKLFKLPLKQLNTYCPSCLGIEATENCEECEQGYIECEYCNGNGMWGCANCEERGMVECPECEGVPSWDCNSCDAQGEVSRECEECEGGGQNSPDCEICDSKGYVEEEKDGEIDRIQCEDCDGLGVIETDCEVCEGAGTLLSDCDDCDGEGTIFCEADCDADGEVSCDECYGEGEIECGECDGDGQHPCETCEGEWRGINCDDCNEREEIADISLETYCKVSDSTREPLIQELLVKNLEGCKLHKGTRSQLENKGSNKLSFLITPTYIAHSIGERFTIDIGLLVTNNLPLKSWERERESLSKITYPHSNTSIYTGLFKNSSQNYRMPVLLFSDWNPTGDIFYRNYPLEIGKEMIVKVQKNLLLENTKGANLSTNVSRLFTKEIDSLLLVTPITVGNASGSFMNWDLLPF